MTARVSQAIGQSTATLIADHVALIDGRDGMSHGRDGRRCRLFNLSIVPYLTLPTSSSFRERA